DAPRRFGQLVWRTRHAHRFAAQMMHELDEKSAMRELPALKHIRRAVHRCNGNVMPLAFVKEISLGVRLRPRQKNLSESALRFLGAQVFGISPFDAEQRFSARDV